MSNKIIQFNKEIIKTEMKDLVRSSVEETLNNLLELLEQEAKDLINAAKNGQKTKETVCDNGGEAQITEYGHDEIGRLTKAEKGG